MAEAIIAGLLKNQLVTPAQIVGSHPRAARRGELEAKYAIRMVENNRAAASPDELEDSNSTEPREESILILCVKPQRLGGVLDELKGALNQDQLVISIVAGATIETISGELLHGAVVRAMPNTPAQIGRGMTAWVATDEVDEQQQGQVRALLGALGQEMHVEKERMIDMATALSATGPT